MSGAVTCGRDVKHQVPLLPPWPTGSASSHTSHPGHGAKRKQRPRKSAESQEWSLQNGGGVNSQVLMLSQIAKFMGPTWGPPGSCRPQVGPMLANIPRYQECYFILSQRIPSYLISDIAIILIILLLVIVIVIAFDFIIIEVFVIVSIIVIVTFVFSSFLSLLLLLLLS